MTMATAGMAVLVALAAAVPAIAQAAPADCPAGSSGVAGTQTLPVSRRVGDDTRPALLLGQPTTLLLAPAAKILFAAPLTRPIGETETGGLVPFHAALSGTYRVALGGRAWVDFVAHNEAMPSGDHGHGDPCSGIAKMVDFALPAGDYMLQLSGTTADAITVTVTLVK